MFVSQRDDFPGQLHEEDLQLHQRRGDAQPVRHLRAGRGGGGRGLRSPQYQVNNSKCYDVVRYDEASISGQLFEVQRSLECGRM